VRIATRNVNDDRIYLPKTWPDNALLQPGARELHARLLKRGWTDSLRKLHPRGALYTFWDCWRNRWQRGAGLRIAHLLLTKSLSPGWSRQVLSRRCVGWIAPAAMHRRGWICRDA
jgi:exodeoxyribonuclease III